MTGIFWVSYAMLWIVVIVQSFAFLEVMRQIAAIRRRVGPDQGAAMFPVETGAPLPELSGVTSDTHEPRMWADYLRSDVGVAVFMTPRCLKCRDVAAGLQALAANLRNRVDVIAVVQGRPEDVEPFISETGLPRDMTVIDEDGVTASRLGIEVTPAALTLREGSIGVAGVVNSAHHVEVLIEQEDADEGASSPSEPVGAVAGVTAGGGE